uniref:Uncharacterized protein n=1 Tax=Romanomermis culicivorax TaxID=13658 RepID=A0A915IXU5_ROMCU
MLGEQAVRRASPSMLGEHARSYARRSLPSMLGERAWTVNSEYKLGVKDHARRIYSVVASLTDRRHPFHRFYIGSTETLLSGDRQNKLRQRTIEFFRTRYSSDLMNLVLVDKRSLDDLQLKVAPLFSQVRRVPNASESAKIEGYPFATKSFLSKMIAIQSLIQTSELMINFHIPSHYSVFEEKKASDYVRRFFTDTSKNTFLYNLKHENMIKPGSASIVFEDFADEYRLCSFVCRLTDHGLAN